MAPRSSVLGRYRLALALLVAAVTAGTLWSAIRNPLATWAGMKLMVHRHAASADIGDGQMAFSHGRQKDSSSPPSGHGTTVLATSVSNGGSQKVIQPDAIGNDVQFVNTEMLQGLAALMGGPGTNSSTPRRPTTGRPAAAAAPVTPAAGSTAAEPAASGTVGESCDQGCRWGREQESRRRRVTETCSALWGRPVSPSLYYRLTADTLRTMTHLLVLPSHRLIYCYVPKVSCTNWKRILLVAKGVAPAASRLEQRATHLAADAHLRTLSSYPLKTAARLLRDYRTFMFARHPFERLLSAYVDKFQLDYPASKQFRQANAAKMARYAAPGSRAGARMGSRADARDGAARLRDGTFNISFPQFARFVADPGNQYLEAHWKEMYRQCQPCMVRYDYVGAYTTLKEDADAIMAATGLANQSFPASTNPTGSSQRARIEQYFSQLAAAEIKALRRRYAVDFDMFGYTVPPYLQNATAGG